MPGLSALIQLARFILRDPATLGIVTGIPAATGAGMYGIDQQYKKYKYNQAIKELANRPAYDEIPDKPSGLFNQHESQLRHPTSSGKYKGLMLSPNLEHPRAMFDYSTIVDPRQSTREGLSDLKGFQNELDNRWWSK